MRGLSRQPLTLAVAVAAACCLAPRPAKAILCSISTTSGVAFGSYNVFSGMPTDAVGSVTFECLLFISADVIVVDISAGGSGTYSPRRMSSGANTLAYNLYLDASRLFVWGDGTNGTFHYGPIALSVGPIVLPIYGRIPALQNAFVGNYSDTVVVSTLF